MGDTSRVFPDADGDGPTSGMLTDQPPNRGSSDPEIAAKGGAGARDSTVIRQEKAEERRLSVIHTLGIITAKLEKMQRETALLIHPMSKWMLRWDVVTMLALMFTATVTPYEIALLETKLDWLFWVNRLVDFAFTLDIGINFFLMYTDATGRMVNNRAKIRMNYVTSWFTLDVLSIIPGYLDCYMVASGDKGSSGQLKGIRATRLAKMGRVIRLLRLLKMARIFRFNRIMQRWITVVNFQYSQLAILKNMALIAVTTHWMACVWLIIPQLEYRSEYTWISDYIITQEQMNDVEVDDMCNVGYMQQSPQVKNGYYWTTERYRDGDVPDDLVSCHGPLDLYAAAIYWSVMTLTSIGYGDITATNRTEYLTCAVVMAMGGCIWAFIIGNICAVVCNVDFTTKNYQETMDQLNYFLAKNVTGDFQLCRQLRQYVIFSKEAYRESSRKDLLSKLPPSLGGECALVSSRHLVESNVPWMKKLSGDTILAIVLRMGTHVHAPQESVIAKFTLFMVHKGVCARVGNILTAGVCWGMDFLLDNIANCEIYPAFTITFVHILSLTKHAMLDVLEVCPLAAPIVHRAKMQLAFYRGVVRLGREKMTREHVKGKTDHHDFFDQIFQAAPDAASEKRMHNEMIVGERMTHRRGSSAMLASLEEDVIGEEAKKLEKATHDLEGVTQHAEEELEHMRAATHDLEVIEHRLEEDLILVAGGGVAGGVAGGVGRSPCASTQQSPVSIGEDGSDREGRGGTRSATRSAAEAARQNEEQYEKHVRLNPPLASPSSQKKSARDRQKHDGGVRKTSRMLDFASSGRAGTRLSLASADRAIARDRHGLRDYDRASVDYDTDGLKVNGRASLVGRNGKRNSVLRGGNNERVQNKMSKWYAVEQAVHQHTLAPDISSQRHVHGHERRLREAADTAKEVAIGQIVSPELEAELTGLREQLSTCIQAVVHAPAELRRLEQRISEGLAEQKIAEAENKALEKKLEAKMEQRMEEMLKDQETKLLAGFSQLLKQATETGRSFK
jgi:potassium voltage-gated channel Eag-related subfamily H protein 7